MPGRARRGGGGRGRGAPGDGTGRRGDLRPGQRRRRSRPTSRPNPSSRSRRCWGSWRPCWPRSTRRSAWARPGSRAGRAGGWSPSPTVSARRPEPPPPGWAAAAGGLGPRRRAGGRCGAVAVAAHPPPGPRRVLVAAVVQVPVRAVVSAWPPAGWWFVACDVGQGDGLVLRAGDDTAVVVDTGPDPVPMDSCLRTLGIHHIALLLLTHMDLDHVGGVAGAVRGRESVGSRSPARTPSPASGPRRCTPRSTARGVPRAGRTGRVDLADRRGHAGVPRAPPGRTGLRAATRTTARWSPAPPSRGTGSCSPPTSRPRRRTDCCAAGADLSADVLKVPHHGSRFTDPAFLAAAHARLAVVSVGAGNRYGHPAPDDDRGAGPARASRSRAPTSTASVAIASGPHGGLVVTTVKAPAGRPGRTDGGARPSRGVTAPAVSEASATMGPCRPPVASSGARGGGGLAATHTVEDLAATNPVPPVVLLLGDEELLVSRAAHAITAAVREQEPAVEIVERPGWPARGHRDRRTAEPVAVRRTAGRGDHRRAGRPGRAVEGHGPVRRRPRPDHHPGAVEHPGGAKGKAMVEAVVAARAPVVACAAPDPSRGAAAVRQGGGQAGPRRDHARRRGRPPRRGRHRPAGARRASRPSSPPTAGGVSTPPPSPPTTAARPR